MLDLDAADRVDSLRRHRRRLFLLLFPLFVLLSSLLLLFVVRRPTQSDDVLELVSLPSISFSTPQHPRGLRGPPTQKFRDNLLQYNRYITSWPSAGWTNDVMAYGNLIYLGLLTERIPIVPKFTPSHVGGHVRQLPFGEVFDVPRISSTIGLPVLEWSDVKDQNSSEIEELGCWSVWQSQQYYENKPRDSWAPDELGLDLAYTRAPEWIKAVPGYEHDKTSNFWDLVKITFPDARKQYLESGQQIDRTPSPVHNSIIDPDEHLMCLDYVFYVGATVNGGYEADFSPAWRFVGKHMHWTKRLERIANEYLRHAFDVADNLPLPPFIAIHMRRGDFHNWCTGIPIDDCLPTLDVINRRVKEIQEELVISFPWLDVQHVVMTSDEMDESWWNNVTQIGWYRLDHSNTEETYGRWYPLIIDAVVQSMGMGFVGTEMSTFSLLARRRVEDWQHGVTRMVRWGHKGADDH